MADPTSPTPRGSGVAFVTGAGGFIGGAAASSLQRAGWTVAALGHAPRVPEPHLDLAGPALRIVGEVDRSMLARAADSLGAPELVVHAAGGASVAASVADPDLDRARTVGSLVQALAFLRDRAPDARLIYPSSAAVHGAAAPSPIPESAPLDPISPYGRHKQMAESLIADAAKGFGLDAVVIRFFSVYGPGLRKQLLWDLAARLVDAPDQLELAGTGDETRDFLFIDDAVRLIGLAAGLERAAAPRIVNGGAGRALTVRQVAETLVRAMAASTTITFTGAVREGDPRSLVADPATLRALGFSPRVPFEAGVERLLDWIRAGAAA